MKKGLFVVLGLVIVSLLAIYILIPSQIRITTNLVTSCDIKNVSDYVHDQQKWKKWWPAAGSGDSNYVYEEASYKLTVPLADGAKIQIGRKDNSLLTTLILLPVNFDSTIMVWKTEIAASSNPFKRVQQYMSAFKIKKDMKAIMKSFSDFVEKSENIYGISVKKDLVKISFMVTTKKMFSHYPSMTEVYAMIADVEKYIADQKATSIDHPMLNVIINDSSHYEAQVAVPVNQKLPETDVFAFKWMPKGGNILITEVKGGLKTVELAQQRFNAFVTDHNLTVMAIPFQSLVTNRVAETDTAKWVTWLYYPIM